MVNFWLNEPNILLNKNHITEFWPNNEYDLARKLNAITRTIIILTILGYFLTKSIKIVVSAVVGLVVLVIIYKSKATKVMGKEAFVNMKKQEAQSLVNTVLQKEFTTPTKKNPAMNVLMNEYKDNPKRKPAAPAYNEEVAQEISENAKTLDPKLYKNLGDNLTFEHSMRNFYAMPNTSIPNNQKEFALFCYGNMPSCKEGDALQCTKNNVSLRTS